ncbi:hypothetical protein BDD12DRAFT_807868 [Trichophaea hybrida]|nr:hypothetical protein BDD12DRAFT_807868 [Trichophaea hybrida]
MDDSDIEIIYVMTTINSNQREPPVAIQPNHIENLEDPLQSIIPIARKVIHLDNDEEDEQLSPEAAPVDDDELELLPITNIATSSTPDIPPIEPVDLDFEVEDLENIKQNDAEFDNMAIPEHDGGTGNDVESQALKYETMNNVYEDCPKPIVLEWENATKKSTKLKPHLHYGSKFCRENDHHEPIKCGHPWRNVEITTIKTYHQWQGIVGYDRSSFWGLGRFRRVIIDQAYRHRVCGILVGNTRRLDRTLVNTPAASYSPVQAAALIRLEPHFKWMLTATPLVYGIEDIHWVLTFLPQGSWLEENLPPNTCDQAAMEPQADEWQPNEMNSVLSTEPDAKFTKMANPSQRGPRTITFDNLQPIINIPRMVMKCQLVTYTEASVLGPATMFPETSRAQMWWESNKSDNERPNMTKVAEMMKKFATAFPGQTDRIPSANQVRNNNYARFEAAMRIGSQEHAFGQEQSEQWREGDTVGVLAYSQWFIEQYCRVLGYNCFAIHSAMGADAR